MDAVPDPRPVHRMLRRLGPVAGVPLAAPAALLLPFWVVAGLTRWLRRRLPLEPAVTDENLVVFEPEIGARPRPHLDTYSRAEDVFRLRTDADGWRGTATLDDADVVAVGDSFAFGYGVDDADVFTEVTTGMSIKAVASPAYSMVHGLLWLRRLRDHLRGRPVVWVVYTGNDLADNLQPDIGTYRMPFVRQDADGDWEVTTAHVSPDPWTFAAPPRPNVRLFAAFSTPGPYSQRVFGAADHLIGEAAAACAQAGSPLSVVSVPPVDVVREPDGVRARAARPGEVDLELPDRRLATICGRHDVRFLPVRSRLRPRDYFGEDMHLNPSGHRVLAAAVQDVVGGHTARVAT